MTKNLIMDVETGEIIGELNEGDRIIRGKSTLKLQTTIGVNSDTEFIKLYKNSIKMLANECDLTKEEYRLCLNLLDYIRYESGVVAYENGKLLTRDDMQRLFNIKERTLDRAIDGLTENKIIAKVKCGKEINFLVNPYIFMRGTRINKTLYDIFKKSKWCIKGMFEG